MARGAAAGSGQSQETIRKMAAETADCVVPFLHLKAVQAQSHTMKAHGIFLISQFYTLIHVSYDNLAEGYFTTSLESCDKL